MYNDGSTLDQKVWCYKMNKYMCCAVTREMHRYVRTHASGPQALALNNKNAEYRNWNEF